MTRNELDNEIETIHLNRLSHKLLRPINKMRKVISKATNTYTNLLLFMNDYTKLYAEHKIDEDTFNSAMNDIYLLALLHTSCEEEVEDV